MSVYVYVATSLDGFIADAEGGLDWLMEVPNPDGSDFGFSAFMAGIDAIVMGRTTFETVVSFEMWPYDKPVFVLSNTAREVPGNLVGKAEIISGDLRNVVNDLERRGYNDLYVDGGRVIQGFLAEDLVDTLIITRVPVILGDGIPLFGKLTEKLGFRHDKTEVLNDTLVKNYYSRERR